MTALELLKAQFNGHVAFRERRPGVIQVVAPLFHEDGDMVDIFLDEPRNGSGKFRVGDHGMTLMRLTYTFDLDTENKQRIFHRILAENRIQEQDGRLYVEAELEQIYPAILHFAQTVAKVSSMQFFKREVIQSLFYEQLAEFIEEHLGPYNPRAHALPIPDHDEYEVDYQLYAGPRPVYLFGVKDSDKARLVTIACLSKASWSTRILRAAFPGRTAFALPARRTSNSRRWTISRIPARGSWSASALYKRRHENSTQPRSVSPLSEADYKMVTTRIT